MTKTWNEHQNMMKERLGEGRMATMEISAKLLGLRIEHGLSPRKVAKLAGMRKKRYKQIEHTKASPTIEELCQLCMAFNVDLSIAIDEEETADG